jgi:putative nucleotidyltransferase with HDIG domain
VARDESADLDAIRTAVPASVIAILDTLRGAGQAVYVVGGSIRDVLLGRPTRDWDLATDALPDRTKELLPGSVYENRFGTVTAPRPDGDVQITTFRSDHDYADHRRPHRVEFGTSLETDLARRDFTVNAIAWGGPGSELVDPFGGRADLSAGVLRAVGDPAKRFEEDALRMIRAVRLATTLGFSIEATTLAAIREHAALVAHLSGERIAMELDKLLAAERPSVGLRLLEETGLLAHISAELAAQPGVPQNKVSGEDLWHHTLRSVDAAQNRPIDRLAALLHDIGKPATQAEGHFYGHEVVGAEQSRALLERLHEPRIVTDRVTQLVRQHMFLYEETWSDSAVRRFIGKVGPDALDELFGLRAADNVGSGLPADAGGLAELRGRVAAELSAGPILDRSALAVDGSDLMAELGIPAGPMLGRLLETLLDRVVEDPSLNDAPTLLLLARNTLAGEG